MSKFNYTEHDRLFTELLVSVESVFSEKEANEVRDFVDVREYELALQTLVDIVVEENKRISRDTFDKCEALVRLMNVENSVSLKQLLLRLDIVQR
jgi:hypothetical protein